MWLRLRQATWYRNIIVWSLIVAIAAAASMAVYTYRGYQSAAAELVIQRDGQVALLSAARLSGELGHFADSLYALARTPAMVGGDPQGQRDELDSAALRLVVFDGGVVLLNSHGIVQGTSPSRPILIGADWSDRESFRQVLLKSDTFISNVVRDGPEGSDVVSIAVPILGPNSEFRGALIGLFDLGGSTRSSLYASIVRLRLIQSGSVFVTDGTNLVIYSTSPQDVGSVIRPPDLPAVANAPGAGSGRTRDAMGRDVVSAYAPVPGTPWTLITEEDWTILTASTRPYRDLFIASLLVAALLPAVGTGILSRQRRLGRMGLDELDVGDDLVRAVQRRLSPHPLPVLPNWASAHRHRLTGGTQRDISDMAIMPDGRLMIGLGRVESSGVDAVLALSAVRTMWRDAVDRRADPCSALERANRVLCAGFAQSLRVSCAFAVVDPVHGFVEYALAGHAAPVVSNPDRGKKSVSVGPALGQHMDSRFDTTHVELGPNEKLLFVSQAMCSARNTSKQVFSEVCLPKFLATESGAPETIADALMLEFDRFIHNSPYAPQEISFLVLLRRGDTPD